MAIPSSSDEISDYFRFASTLPQGLAMVKWSQTPPGVMYSDKMVVAFYTTLYQICVRREFNNST